MSGLEGRIKKLERVTPEWDRGRVLGLIFAHCRAGLPTIDADGREVPSEPEPMPVLPPEDDISFWGRPDDPEAAKLRALLRVMLGLDAAEQGSARP